MAATLRDMIALERQGRQLTTRIFYTPETLERAFAPQSAWGRDLLQSYTNRWEKSLGILAGGLKRRNELQQALSPAGLRIPIERSFLDAVPEYNEVDNLLHWVTLDMCDEAVSPPNCYIHLYLSMEKDNRIKLLNLRIVAPDGSPISIRGKVQ